MRKADLAVLACAAVLWTTPAHAAGTDVAAERPGILPHVELVARLRTTIGWTSNSSTPTSSRGAAPTSRPAARAPTGSRPTRVPTTSRAAAEATGARAMPRATAPAGRRGRLGRRRRRGGGSGGSPPARAAPRRERTGRSTRPPDQLTRTRPRGAARGLVARALAARHRAELEDERGPGAVPDRRAVDEPDPDVAERRVEDHRAVRRAVHPRVDDRLRGGRVRRRPAEVLADDPARGGQVPGAPRALVDGPAARRHVREVAAGDHVGRVAPGGGLERARPIDGGQPVCGALAVDEAGDRGLDGSAGRRAHGLRGRRAGRGPRPGRRNGERGHGRHRGGEEDEGFAGPASGGRRNSDARERCGPEGGRARHVRTLSRGRSRSQDDTGPTTRSDERRCRRRGRGAAPTAPPAGGR